MIHYHGTPMGGLRADIVPILSGRHAFVPFGRDEDLPVAMECCQSFALDNGAYTAWRQGKQATWQETLEWAEEYSAWVADIMDHPAFDWAIIPDVIATTDETQNDTLIKNWLLKYGSATLRSRGVPVWHLHEPLARLDWLAGMFPRVCLGSSGEWPIPGKEDWWQRMSEVMNYICDDKGCPKVKLHGLRMLNPNIFCSLPLASADSTNVARNKVRASLKHKMSSPWQGAAIMLWKIEAQQSVATWQARAEQLHLFE